MSYLVNFCRNKQQTGIWGFFSVLFHHPHTSTPHTHTYKHTEDMHKETQNIHKHGEHAPTHAKTHIFKPSGKNQNNKEKKHLCYEIQGRDF